MATSVASVTTARTCGIRVISWTPEAVKAVPNPDLHPGLEAGDGATCTTEDEWTLVRRGDDVVCIAPLASLVAHSPSREPLAA
jgi:hypothetical protein